MVQFDKTLLKSLMSNRNFAILNYLRSKNANIFEDEEIVDFAKIKEIEGNKEIITWLGHGLV